MPAFVRPQQNPAASQPELSEEQRKQDCEHTTAKPWLPRHIDALLPPIPRGGDLYCRQSLCDLGADFISVCKPNSHKRFYKLLHDDSVRSAGGLKARNSKRQVESRRFRWIHEVPVRDSDDAVLGVCVETRRTRSTTSPTAASVVFPAPNAYRCDLIPAPAPAAL